LSYYFKIIRTNHNLSKY